MVERFEDVYSFNIEGNFQQQLDALQREIAGSKSAWAALRADLTRGADVFRKVSKGAKEAADGQAATAKTAKDLRPEMEKIATSAQTAAGAYNSLVRSQNRLNQTRAAELQVLRQAAQQQDPNIIAIRAETRAIKTLTAALEQDAFQRKVHRLAAEAGLQLTADGSRLFNAEAIAAERAAKSVQDLAVAEELRKRGLDLKGNPLLQGPLTQEAAKLGLSQQELLAAEQAAIGADRKKSIDDHTKSLRNLREETDKNKRSTTNVADQFRKIGESASKSNTIIGQFLFTFRRLVGVLAVFAVARNVARGFAQMVSGAIQFNAQLERNRVGMAGLIAASGQVLDAQGKRIPIEEQLNVAQDLAIKQMRELRKDAIRTVATYEDLSEAFSQSIAPGISAGLDLDTIRQVTVQISQAAAGLGLAQNQLAEEIRALFQGTITPRNTRIATALGITNEDIRRARELGNLSTFLKTRFEAVAKSGKRLTDTFAGQVNAAQDAFKQLVAESSKPLFGQLKAGLKDFNTKIFQDLKNEPIIDPQALKLFDQLFKGIAQGVRNIRASFSDLDIQGFADSFGLIGRSIGTIATVLSATLSSVFKTASPLLTIFNSLLGLLNNIFTAFKAIDTKTLGVASSLTFAYLRVLALFYAFKKVKALVITTAAAMRAFTFALSAASSAAIVMETRFANVTKLAAILKATVLTATRPILIAAAALFVVDAALKAFGVDGGAIGLIGDAFVALNDYIDDALSSWVGLNAEAEKTSKEGLGQIADGFKQLSGEIQQVTDQIRKDLIGNLALFADELTALKLTPSGGEQLLALSQVLADSAELFQKTQDNFDLNVTGLRKAEAAIAGLSNQIGEVYINRLGKANTEVKQLEESYNDLKVALVLAEGAAAEGSLTADIDRAKYTKQLVELEPKLTAAREEQAAAAKEHNRLEAALATEQANVNRLYVERSSLIEKLNTLQDSSLQKQALLAQKFAAAQRAAVESQRPSSELDAIRERAVVDLLKLGDEGRIKTLDAVVAARREELAVSEEQQRRANEILVLQQRQQDFEKTNATFAYGAAKATKLQLAALVEQDGILTKSENARVARLKEEERLAQLRETGSIGDGFSETIKKLANEKDSLFLVGENLAQGIFTGIPETLGNIVSTSLRDGFSSAEALDAFRNLLFNAIGQFVQDLATAFLANLLGGGTADLLGTEAMIAGVKAAALEMGAAAGAVAGAIGSALGTGAAKVAASGAVVGSAALILLAAATALKAANPFGGLFGRAKGGPIHGNLAQNRAGVQGFARGGSPRRRPLGIDARDTVPALLRPGEWVIRPEAVKHYGHRLFALLNGRKINRSALSGIRAASAPTVTPPRSGGYATGGPVASRGAAPTQTVQTVLQFHDEQTLDRALAAGSRSMVRFTRHRRAQMRSALGLQEN